MASKLGVQVTNKIQGEKVTVKEIGYSDFMFIDNFISDISGRSVDFMDYLVWLSGDNFKPLEQYLCEKLKLNQVSEKNFDSVLEGIIPATESQLNKKPMQKHYYECQASAIMYVVKRIFTKDFVENALVTANNDENTRFLVNNYKKILRDIQLDIEDLANRFSQNIENDNAYKSYIRSRFMHPVSLHQVVRQILFGTASFHSFADKHPSAAISAIRQLIEVRIRNAFGTLAFIDTQQNDAISPLDMSVVFEVLLKHKDSIEVPIKLENIKRIYSWSNIFVHSGLEDYSWMPFYVEYALRELSFGYETEHGFDVNNGIATTQEAIGAIHRELEVIKNKGQSPQRYYLLTGTKPECRIK